MADRYLIVGGDSVIGRALTEEGRAAGQPTVLTSRRSPLTAGAWPLDLASDSWTLPSHCAAAVLCAGVTSLDACRQDPQRSRHLNVTQTVRLAHRLAEQRCFVLFLSTNLVFDGSQPFRRATDPVCPRTEYGRQKAEAEAAILQLGDRAAVARLSKVLHPDLPLLRTWRDNLKQGRPVTAFSNYVCSPIPLATIVTALWRILERQLPGFWQLSGKEDVPYSSLALKLASRLGAPANLVHITQAHPTASEHIPSHTTLDTSAAVRSLRYPVCSSEEALDQALPLPGAGGLPAARHGEPRASNATEAPA